MLQQAIHEPGTWEAYGHWPNSKCIEVGISYVLMTEDNAERKHKTYKVNQADGEQEGSFANSFASWFEEQDQVVQFRFILGWQVFSCGILA